MGFDRYRTRAIFAAAIAMAFVTLSFPARAAVTIFAASSITEIMETLADNFSRNTGIDVSVVPAGSATLAQQIAAGAPADIFVSANKEWISYVRDKAGFGQGVELFGNQLALIAPAGSTITIAKLSDLGQIVEGKRLAMGNPAYVPAGIYGREALKKIGIWDKVKPWIAPAANVRAALNLVLYGAAELGIVYKTDAMIKGVRIVLPIDPALHDKISYIGALAPKATAEAKQFFSYLQGKQAMQTAAKMGYLTTSNAD
ncbi:Molybdenum ABC transporter, substrate-binding protein ModA [hydrothermal vent metagenome]|uniref:Molybdenum ABC transporter, substrate-binding protein ModA n=1 Tax=hydrothermal vent metagenome TaxID=652676 RepID=A0A3B0U8Q8_9ZZZZ